MEVFSFASANARVGFWLPERLNYGIITINQTSDVGAYRFLRTVVSAGGTREVDAHPLGRGLALRQAPRVTLPVGTLGDCLAKKAPRPPRPSPAREMRARIPA